MILAEITIQTKQKFYAYQTKLIVGALNQEIIFNQIEKEMLGYGGYELFLFYPNDQIVSVKINEVEHLPNLSSLPKFKIINGSDNEITLLGSIFLG